MKAALYLMWKNMKSGKNELVQFCIGRERKELEKGAFISSLVGTRSPQGVKEGKDKQRRGIEGKGIIKSMVVESVLLSSTIRVFLPLPPFCAILFQPRLEEHKNLFPYPWNNTTNDKEKLVTFCVCFFLVRSKIHRYRHPGHWTRDFSFQLNLKKKTFLNVYNCNEKGDPPSLEIHFALEFGQTSRGNSLSIKRSWVHL